MSANEFDCLSNALLQAGLRNHLPVAFAVPGRVRDMLQMQKIDVKDVWAVTIHQCPGPQGIVDYRLEVHARHAAVPHETFQGSGLDLDHDTYTLYDRHRDGQMKHLHVTH